MKRSLEENLEEGGGGDEKSLRLKAKLHEER